MLARKVGGAQTLSRSNKLSKFNKSSFSNLSKNPNISTNNKVKFMIMNAIILAILIGAGSVFFVAMFCAPTAGEAYRGNFDACTFNEGWEMTDPEGIATVNLPFSKNEIKNKTILLQNTLPEYVKDGMTFTIRTSVRDIYIYIDEELRGEYSSDQLSHDTYHLPSAYVSVDLTNDDAQKPITVRYTVKASKTNYFGDAYIAYGANAWFNIIFMNLPVVVASIFASVIALIAFISAIFIKKKTGLGNSIFFLSETIIVVSLWILSESAMRQIFFNSPSLTNIFSYIFMQLISCTALQYVNEIQHGIYHRIYLPLQIVFLSLIAVLGILNYTGIAEYYDTLILSHISIVIGIIILVSTIANDVRTRRFAQYKIVGHGLIAFAVFCCLETLGFYVFNFYTRGIFVCIGLFVLLIMTIIQVVIDEIRVERQRREKIQRMSLAIVKTVANAIDAKDRYTGGHSERVARYGKLLAMAVEEKYGLTDQMINSIEYSGIIHDIGKIAIPDDVLNKPSSLTYDEFSLMKKHPALGFQMIRSIDFPEGVADGVKYHHERYDGRGYPEGLSGDEIPLFARILCIADAYDAMTSDRVYRKRLGNDQIRKELIENSGKQFDPYLVDVFLKLIYNIEK